MRSRYHRAVKNFDNHDNHDQNSGSLLHGVENISKFMLAGLATITVVSKKTGTRFTYKIKKKEGSEDFWFVGLLNGPDNETNYTYMGHIALRQVFTYFCGHTKVGAEAPSQTAFIYLCQALFRPGWANPEYRLAQIEVWHEGKCGRCGRKLTVPESIESGYGPECINHV